MGAPEGFRSISLSQAMMEYAKPLMKFVEDDEKEFNDAMEISILLWNYALCLEQGNEDKMIEKKILKALKATFGLDESEVHALFTKMVERRSYLFPPDKQPKASMPFMFIRKEIRYLIGPFDYEKLVLSDEIIPPHQNDREVINKIERLDSYIYDGTEYGMYENLFLSLKNECQDLFEKWLIAKGLKDDSQDFSFCLDTYFDFIYGYMHDDIVVLKSVQNIPRSAIGEEFGLKWMEKPR